MLIKFFRFFLLIAVLFCSVSYPVQCYANAATASKITVKQEKTDKDKEDPTPEAEKSAFIYRPKFRDGSYLADLLSPLFKGAFTASRGVRAPDTESRQDAAMVPPGSAAAMVDRKADTLVFFGTDAEIETLKKLLAEVDVSIGEVLVRGVLFEVATGNNQGTGIQLAASLLNGALMAGFGGPIVPVASMAANQFLQYKGSPANGVSVDAVMSALSTDTRFKVVSSPSLRVLSGSTAHITIGQDVPILGALSFPQGAGQAVQSVQYRSAGVLFDLTPSVRESVIDLKINQQVSSFVQTNTGVNNSPTLTKREISTLVSTNDGDVIVLGGLNETKTTNTQSGLSFIPDWIFSDTTSQSESEIILILQITRV
ncbi:type II secretion system protein GspD [Candidatus Methylobacter oryzae]|uniref:Type II secretory pathway, component PulD n=1 Tax=Candidatus Methylobacter oryzae TaxID=2497749 RepID=A0ABY3CGL8_9GAMM|nr:type II secretory pathway, component PulD [Candidatus Methylobacter oryzae]TRW99933.1 type II secretory pathway, component PulD [Candidatus Methylobacter oryzae]